MDIAKCEERSQEAEREKDQGGDKPIRKSLVRVHQGSGQSVERIETVPVPAEAFSRGAVSGCDIKTLSLLLD